MEPDQLKDEIEQLQVLFGFTQQEIAVILQCNQSIIGRSGRGERKLPAKSMKLLEGLLAITGKVVEDSPQPVSPDTIQQLIPVRKIQLAKIKLVKRRSKFVVLLDNMNREYQAALMRSRFRTSLLREARASRNAAFRTVLQGVVAKNNLALHKYGPVNRLELELQLAKLDGAIQALDDLLLSKGGVEHKPKVKIPIRQRSK